MQARSNPFTAQRVAKIKRWMDSLRYTPLHPQFLANRRTHQRHQVVLKACKGKVLDIGCGRQPLREQLSVTCDYVALDFPQTGAWYEAQPNVFGDASRLPFACQSFDTILCLEVLEHLPRPINALREAERVLKPNGRLIMSTPFLYPIHDAPSDYSRWTIFGLEQMARDANFCVDSILPSGTAVESGALLLNLGLAWRTMNAPLMLKLVLTIPVLALIPIINLIGFGVALLSGTTSAERFPIGYMCILKPLVGRKRSHSTQGNQ